MYQNDSFRQSSLREVVRSVYITCRFRPHSVIGPRHDRPYVFLTVIGPDPVWPVKTIFASVNILCMWRLYGPLNVVY